MIVPVTSDLVGYAAFWHGQILRLIGSLCALAVVLVVPTWVLLYKILQAVRRAW